MPRLPGFIALDPLLHSGHSSGANIAKLDSPTKGTIETSSQAGLVFQDADAQILGETCEEDVAFGAKNSGYKKEALKEKVIQTLEATGLLYKKTAAARTMSGGEKRSRK